MWTPAVVSCLRKLAVEPCPWFHGRFCRRVRVDSPAQLRGAAVLQLQLRVVEGRRLLRRAGIF